MGGQTSIEQPQMPAQASSADAVNAWIAGMPQVYATQMQYAPLQAQQQVSLAQQYAQPYGEAMQTAQEAMYPGTSKIQENLANIANTGMSATKMPDWMRQNYLSDYNSQLGSNAGSGMGADYVSKGMQQQLFNQQQYYQNLGLSVAGRNPLAQPNTPQTSDYMSSFSPQTMLGYNQAQNSSANSLYGSMYGSNAQAMGYGGVNLGILGRWGGG